MKRKKKRSKYRENINKRILIYIVIVTLLFMVIILRLFQVMIIDNKKYKNKLDELTLKVVEKSQAPRGRIYDRNYNVIMDDCYISFDLLKDKVSSLEGDVCYVSSSGFNDSICYVPDIERLFKYLDRSKVCSSFSFVPNYLKRVEAEEKLNG